MDKETAHFQQEPKPRSQVFNPDPGVLRGDYIHQLLTILFIRKNTILIVAFICFVGSILVALFWPPTYFIRSSILLKARKLERSPEVLQEDVGRVPEVSKEFINSEMELLKSPELMKRTLEALSREDPRAMADMKKDSPVEAAMVAAMLRRFRTEAAPDSNVIRVALLFGDPERGRRILDIHMKEYAAFRFAIYNPSQAESFFSDQTQKYDKQLEALDQRLLALSKTANSADPVKEIENNLFIKKDLQAQKDLVENLIIEKRKMLEHLSGLLSGRESAFFSSLSNPLITSLGEKLQELYAERGALLRVYTAQSVNVARLDEQIDETRKMLRNEVRRYEAFERSQMAALDEKIRSMNDRIEAVNQRNLELQSADVGRQQIERERALVKASFENFFRRWEEAKISSNSSLDEFYSISIASAPFYKGRPEFPRKEVVIPLGLLLGLLAGVTIGFVQEYFDPRIRTRHDVARYLELPVLFSLSKWR